MHSILKETDDKMATTSAKLRFGITLQGVEPPDVFQQQVRTAEASGFTHLWVTDSSLHARYTYAYLTLAALNSERLLLGPGVTNPHTRHPGITVNAMATLDEISHGRALLGIGAGDSPTAELGFSPARLQVIREMVESARCLMAGDTATYTGSTFKMVDAKLHYKYRDRIPIYMACSGPRMLELAGEIADGVIAQCGPFPEAVDFARERIAEGAHRAGRSPDEVDVWIMGCGTIAEDRDEALNGSRTMAAWFAQTAPYYCELAGADPELIAAIQDAYSGGEFHLAKRAATLVPDEMVELFTVAGTPADVYDRLTRLANHGVTGINFMPIGPKRNDSLRLFSEHVSRPLQSERA